MPATRGDITVHFGPQQQGGDDFSWINHWDRLDAATTESMGVMESSNQQELLLVEKVVAASAIIFLSSNKYVWFQMGD